MLKIFLIAVIIINLSYSQEKYPKREFRGAWVATVANIDWPSARNLTSGQKIAELVEMFDKLKEAGMNAILFQVRTECDALYNSEYEPWSYWLTGEQGRAPEPFFDPLEFAIDEAHKRGMELHAWLNPYRSVKTVGAYTVYENHVSKLHPDWILNFDNYKMIDPGNPEVKKYIVNIIEDILNKYDVDGIHFDDYFYPYSPKVSTEDSGSWKKYRGDFTSIDDWRRNNINSMVADVYESINKIKPHVKFGISPFGIVENKYAGTNGFESYNILYCDPLTWISDRTVDYVTPQLYWEIGRDVADYADLLPWWSSIMNERHLYIGHFSSRFARWEKNRAEMGDQLRLNRKSDITGSIFFSAKSISRNSSGLADTLKSFYKYPALPPAMSWKDSILPLPVQNLILNSDSTGVLLKWDTPRYSYDGEPPSYYIVYRFNSPGEINLNNASAIIHLERNGKNSFHDKFPLTEKKEFTYIVTSVDKMHNESEANSFIIYRPD